MIFFSESIVVRIVISTAISSLRVSAALPPPRLFTVAATFACGKPSPA